MKNETLFRQRVNAFYKTLENTVAEPIAQKSIRGTADHILCAYGFFVWAEIKTDEGQLSPLQEYKSSLIRNKGRGISLVVRPSNFKEVKDFLITLDRGVYDPIKLSATKSN